MSIIRVIVTESLSVPEGRQAQELLCNRGKVIAEQIYSEVPQLARAAKVLLENRGDMWYCLTTNAANADNEQQIDPRNIEKAVSQLPDCLLFIACKDYEMVRTILAGSPHDVRYYVDHGEQLTR